MVVCDKYLVFVVLRWSWGTWLRQPWDIENYYGLGLFLGWMAFLDVKAKRMVHRTIVPHKMAASLGCSSSNFSYMVAGAGHYVCICNRGSGAEMIAYDFSRKEWEEWPRCPFPLEKREKSKPWLPHCLSHNGISGAKEARSSMDYQLSLFLDGLPTQLLASVSGK